MSHPRAIASVHRGVTEDRGAGNLVPVLLKHPRCQPFFRLAEYGVVAGRVDADGARVFDRDDLELLDLDIAEVHDRGRRNLEAIFDRGEIALRPARVSGKLLLWIEHPLAASCLFLSTLIARAKVTLGVGRLTFAIFRRDLVAIFEDRGPVGRVELARAISQGLRQRGTFDLDLFDPDEVASRAPRPRQFGSGLYPRSRAPSPPPSRQTGATFDLPRTARRLDMRQRDFRLDDETTRLTLEPPTVRATSSS